MKTDHCKQWNVAAIPKQKKSAFASRCDFVQQFSWGYTGLGKIILDRTIPVGRDLRKPSGVASLPKPGSAMRSHQPCDHTGLLRTLSSWGLKTSQDGGCAASLGNLFQCLTVLVVKDFLPTRSRTLCCLSSSSCYAPLGREPSALVLTTASS